MKKLTRILLALLPLLVCTLAAVWTYYAKYSPNGLQIPIPAALDKQAEYILTNWMDHPMGEIEPVPDKVYYFIWIRPTNTNPWFEIWRGLTFSHVFNNEGVFTETGIKPFRVTNNKFETDRIILEWSKPDKLPAQ